MSIPFFSIIVPAHNAATYIRKCLDSIKHQSFKDYELIIVCDACNDETEKVAMEYTEHVIRTDYGMDGLARNAGIDAAKGRYILFLDDDDWWMHDYVLHYIYRAAAFTGADLITMDFLWPGEKRGLFYWSQQELGLNIAPWSKAYRHGLIGSTRFPAIQFTSDVPFYWAILEKKPIVHHTNKLMYYYNFLRPGSQTEINERKEDAKNEKL